MKTFLVNSKNSIFGLLQWKSSHKNVDTTFFYLKKKKLFLSGLEIYIFFHRKRKEEIFQIAISQPGKKRRKRERDI